MVNLIEQIKKLVKLVEELNKLVLKIVELAGSITLLALAVKGLLNL